MNKHKLTKSAKIALVISIALLMLYGISTPVFASMGSTGGFSTGGFSTGGVGNFSSNGHGFKMPTWQYICQTIIGLIISFFVIISYIFLWFYLKNKLFAFRIHRQYNSNFLFNKKYKKFIHLFDQPPKRIFFDTAFQVFDYYGDLKSIPDNEISQEKWKDLTDLYIQAQSTYCQLIKDLVVTRRANVFLLNNFLDKIYYNTMVDEINLKARNKTVDNTVIDEAKVIQVYQCGNLYITKIKVNGKDEEIQYNHNFDSSFSRKEWEDYVIFGKEKKTGKIKIITLMYGEHAHLNGQDFNNDSSLDKNSKFEEHHYDNLGRKIS